MVLFQVRGGEHIPGVKRAEDDRRIRVVGAFGKQGGNGHKGEENQAQ